MEKIKITIGIVGCGNIVQMVHLPVLLNIRNVDIRFLYDVDMEKSKALAESFKLPYIMDKEEINRKNVDCILVATPYGSREDLYKIITPQKTALFIEKPVILSEKDVQAFKDNGLFERSFSGFMRRHYSNTNILKDFIGSMFHKIKRITVSEGSKTTAVSKELSYQTSGALSGGGILAETSCHLLDQVVYMLPGADYKIDNCFIVYDGDIEVHAKAKIVLIKDGVSIPIEAEFSRLKELPNEISVDFGDMILKSGIVPGDKVSICLNSGETHQIDYNPFFAINSYQAFYLEWISVINAIKSNIPSVNALSKTFQSGLIIESLRDYSNTKGTFKRI